MGRPPVVRLANVENITEPRRPIDRVDIDEQPFRNESGPSVNAKLPLTVFTAYVVAAPATDLRRTRPINRASSGNATPERASVGADSATIARWWQRFSWRGLGKGQKSNA